jgi:hypothetical protein
MGWTMKPAMLPALLLSLATCCSAPKAADSPAAVSLAELARQAELVALAQVRDTDYRMQRGIPVSGSAFLRLLIPYKLDRPELRSGDIVEVYERGLRAGECYFPNPTVYEEGRRYLLFLRRDPEAPERYRGLTPGCAIDVLVDRDNRYVLRIPVTGIPLADALASLAEPMQFADPYAVIDDEALPPSQRNAMLAAGQIEAYTEEIAAADPRSPAAPPPAQRWRYTRGIELTAIRDLLQLERDL